MLLAIDVGNTDVKLGLWSGQWSVVRRATSSLRDIGMGTWLREFLNGQPIVGAICASVVPPLDGSIKMAVRAVSGKELVFLNANLPLNMEIRYRTPNTLGADRIANALGLTLLFQGASIAVDFGTATKLEAVDAGGAYLGGAILPGLATGAQSLVKQASKIPTVAMEMPEKAIGDDTISALQSGIMLGHIGAVQDLVRRFRSEMGGQVAAVVGTGGMAEKLVPHCSEITHHEADLTLMGLLGAAHRLKIV